MHEYVNAVEISEKLFISFGHKSYLPITPMFVKTGNTLPQLRLPNSAQRLKSRRGENAKNVVTNLNTKALAICTRAIELVLNP